MATATISELVNSVCDDINRTDLTAQCSDAVVMAIRHYDRKRWWFSEGSAQFTTTSNTSVYSLPSDYRELDYVEVRLPGDNWAEVLPRPFATVRKMNEGASVSGYPEVYAVRSQKIHLAYQPNGAYIVKLYYLKALPELSGSESNAWTIDCKDLIRSHAASVVALRTLHDRELAGDFSLIKDSEYLRLLEENDRRVSTDSVAVKY